MVSYVSEILNELWPKLEYKMDQQIPLSQFISNNWKVVHCILSIYNGYGEWSEEKSKSSTKKIKLVWHQTSLLLASIQQINCGKCKVDIVITLLRMLMGLASSLNIKCHHTVSRGNREIKWLPKNIRNVENRFGICSSYHGIILFRVFWFIGLHVFARKVFKLISRQPKEIERKKTKWKLPRFSFLSRKKFTRISPYLFHDKTPMATYNVNETESKFRMLFHSPLWFVRSPW